MGEFKNSILFEVTEYFQEFSDLSNVLFEPFSILVEEDDGMPPHFQVYSSLILDTDSNEIVFSKIKTLTHLFFGAMRLTATGNVFGNIEDFKHFNIRRVFKKGSPLALPVFEEVPFYDFVESNVSTNYDEYSSHLVHKAMNKCFFNKNVFNMLLVSSDRYDYVDMYKILEIVKQEIGSNFLNQYKSEIDKFTCSANNFTATGFASRHANDIVNAEQVKAIKDKYISIQESRKLFRRIFENLLKSI